jgi:iron complex transport system substrate-binding protein
MANPRMRASALQLFGAVALAALCAMPLRAEEATEAVDTSRILSIGGDVTEILYALKADGKIIAVDSTSQFPAEALKDKPDVGYLRALSAEGVLATNPTLILASKDAGPPPVVAALKASSIPYVEIPDDDTPEGVAAKIRFVAAEVGAQEAGEALGQGGGA